MNILGIDDEQGVHEIVKFLIKTNKEFSDWKYHEALKLEDGVSLAKTLKPQAILLDVHFGPAGEVREDGIKAIPELDQIGAVVMITGYATDDRRVTSIKKGALGFLDKNKVLYTSIEAPGALQLAAQHLFGTIVMAVSLWDAKHGK